jgi:hypothetical protein
VNPLPSPRVDPIETNEEIDMAGKTIVALYDDFSEAVRAVRDLEEAGVQHKDVSLVANNAENRWQHEAEPESRETHVGEGATTGATIGAIAGGTAGLLASLGTIAIPGIGPVLAAGPIVAMITGAGVGAAAGGLIGGLVGLGVPEEEAHAYAEGVRRGGALVTARVTEKDVQRAVDILEGHDAVDVKERQASWRQSGWQRFDHRAEPWSKGSVEEERARWGGSRQTTGLDAPVTPSTSDMPGVRSDTADALRSGTIRKESDTARMTGGPVPTASTAMPGSVEGLREQKEPLQYHGDATRTRVRSYDDSGASPGDRVNAALDRAAAGDKPMHAEDDDRYGGKDPLAGRK